MESSFTLQNIRTELLGTILQYLRISEVMNVLSTWRKFWEKRDANAIWMQVLDKPFSSILKERKEKLTKEDLLQEQGIQPRNSKEDWMIKVDLNIDGFKEWVKLTEEQSMLQIAKNIYYTIASWHELNAVDLEGVESSSQDYDQSIHNTISKFGNYWSSTGSSTSKESEWLLYKCI